MKTMTKMFALGGLGAVGAGVFAAIRMARRKAAMHMQQPSDAFDYGDLETPVVVTEEVFVVTDRPF